MLVTLTQALCQIQDFQAQGIEQIALDIETTGLDPFLDKLVAIQFGTVDTPCVLDCREVPCEDLRPLVKDFTHFTCIGHNIKFDIKFLRVKTGIMVSNIIDTQIQELIIGGGKYLGRHMTSMDVVAIRYGLTVSKEERAWFIGLDTRPLEWNAPFPKEQIAYMEQDVIIPCQLAAMQVQKLQSSNQLEVAEIENFTLPVIAQVELNGCPLDTELLSRITKRKSEERKNLEQEIKKMLHPYVSAEKMYEYDTWHERYAKYSEDVQNGKRQALPKKYQEEIQLLNLSSPKQLLEVLQKCGVSLLKTDEETLSGLAEKHRVCKLLLEWRKANTFIVKFGDKLPTFLHSHTGRIHPSYNQLGTRTGRMSCSKPNWQQLPRPKKGELEPLRSCVRAPEGSKILTADFANIEMCIVADLSQDQLMLRLFDEGTDLHSATARFLFKLTEADNPKELVYEANGMTYRDIAKRMNFALVYGGGTLLLAKQIGVDKDTATDLLQRYFQTYPMVEKWLNKTVSHALRCGYTTTVAGRRRYYPQEEKPVYDEEEFSSYEEYQEFLSEEYYTEDYYRKQGSYKRQAKNAPVQGTSCDITKFALVLLAKHMPVQAKIIAIVHDEIVVECPIEYVEETKAILGKAMDKACTRYLTRVKVASTKVCVEDYWVKD